MREYGRDRSYVAKIQRRLVMYLKSWVRCFYRTLEMLPGLIALSFERWVTSQLKKEIPSYMDKNETGFLLH